MAVARKPMRGRTRVLVCGGLAAALAAAAVGAALAAASKPVVISDRSQDVGGPLDLTRVSLRRASDGRLRAVVSFADRVSPRMLLAGSGPPGSSCLRVWTSADADPAAERPDRLVCVTARSEDELRGGVYEVRGADLPDRVADASVTVTKSGRSVVVRFTQSSIGRPRGIQFAAEATSPGCTRADCIDTAPERAAARRFRLR